MRLELAAERVDVLTRIDRPSLPATRSILAQRHLLPIAVAGGTIGDVYHSSLTGSLCRHLVLIVNEASFNCRSQGCR